MNSVPYYDLSGLSPSSFEHLIQALFLKIIGPGGIIFGTGPDGGREATFRGSTTYPSKKEPWSGYIVVQAKFLQISRGSTAKDGEWVLERLREEIAKLKRRKNKLYRPEYYILCTNVNLTSVWKSGTKDKIYQEFRRSRIHLRDARVWDYDQINRFLDAAPEIRRTYACWIQPGDVLSEVIESLDNLQTDFHNVISLYLQKQLIRDHFLRFDQSGFISEANARTSIEHVFVDLSASREESINPPPNEQPKMQLPPGFTFNLLTACAEKCDLATVRHRGIEQIESGLGSRILLVGAPGQGKTTIGQYLCQLHRVALLRNRLAYLDDQVTSVIKSIEAHSTEENLKIPSARRYPVRVDLNEFAKIVALTPPNRISSILAYLAEKIRMDSGYKVETASVRKWLASYPWLLVLDGLDEVPASANRIQVVQLINDLLIDVANENGDVFILITTRRQGYQDDFPQECFQCWYLTPLSEPRALRCAERFTRFHMGEMDHERVMNDLQHAIHVEETARLMRSPLQVAIMATLAQSGSLANNRWQLFSEYYRTIYDREISKDLWKVLKTNREDIWIIHNRLAVLLQIECECMEQPDARFPLDKFSRIVVARLQEQQYASKDIERLKTEIVKATSERLPFIIGAENNRVGFEIRSLQEFMAAGALLHGPEQSILERLQHIAALPHWRNVLLFAAANIFSDREWLGDAITGMCFRLNHDPNDSAAALALVGSQLALDLVEVGVISRQSRHCAALNEIATDLVSRPPSRFTNNFHTRLAFLHNASNCLRIRLEKALRATDIQQQFGAWATLMALISLGDKEAMQLADSAWPATKDAQITILEMAVNNPINDWTQTKVLDAYSEFSLEDFHKYSTFLQMCCRHYKKAFTTLPFPWAMTNDIFHCPCKENSNFQFRMCKLRAEALQQVNDSFFKDLRLLKFTRAVKAFSQKPSTQTLAATLVAAVPLWQTLKRCPFWLPFWLPWPIGTVLSSCLQEQDCFEAAQVAASGGFGSPEDWESAELRWCRGWAIEDVLAFDAHGAKLGAYLRESGIPLLSATVSILGTAADGGIYSDVFYKLMQTLSEFKNKQVKKRVAEIMLILLPRCGVIESRTILDLIDISQTTWINLSTASNSLPSLEERLNLYKQLGQHRLTYLGLFQMRETEKDRIVYEFATDPNCVALLPIIRAILRQWHVNISRPVLEYTRPILDFQKMALLVVIASQINLNVQDAQSLATQLCVATETDCTVAIDALAAARAYIRDESVIAELASGLIRCLPEQSWLTKAAAFDALDEAIRRRKSSFKSLLPATLYSC